MKKLFLFSCIVYFLFSCKSNKADQPAVTDDSATAPIIYLWESDLDDSTGDLKMKKIETDLDTLAADTIAARLSGEHLVLQYVKTSHDTIFIRIPDSDYLTQRLGSTGAMMRMAMFVYDFTELPGIRYVNFDFEEGDHAAPGTYSRESFNNQ